jgi:hypothetical protein
VDAHALVRREVEADQRDAVLDLLEGQPDRSAAAIDHAAVRDAATGVARRADQLCERRDLVGAAVRGVQLDIASPSP